MDGLSVADIRRELAGARALLAEKQHRLGPRHPQSQEARLDLALLTWARSDDLGRSTSEIRRDLEAARSLLQELLPDQAAVHGVDSHEVLLTRSSIAMVKWGLGLVDEALADLRALLPDEERVFGADDERTIETIELLQMPYGVDAINEKIAYDLASDPGATLSRRTTLELCTAENADFLMYLLVGDVVPPDTVELILSLPEADWRLHQEFVALNYRHLTDRHWRELVARGFIEDLAMREDAPDWFRERYGDRQDR